MCSFFCVKNPYSQIFYTQNVKNTQKRLNFSKFGITKFNLVVFTISQWDLVLQLSISLSFFFSTLLPDVYDIVLYDFDIFPY